MIEIFFKNSLNDLFESSVMNFYMWSGWVMRLKTILFISIFNDKTSFFDGKIISCFWFFVIFCDLNTWNLFIIYSCLRFSTRLIIFNFIRRSFITPFVFIRLIYLILISRVRFLAFTRCIAFRNCLNSPNSRLRLDLIDEILLIGLGLREIFFYLLLFLREEIFVISIMNNEFFIIMIFSSLFASSFFFATAFEFITTSFSKLFRTTRLLFSNVTLMRSRF